MDCVFCTDYATDLAGVSGGLSDEEVMLTLALISQWYSHLYHYNHGGEVPSYEFRVIADALSDMASDIKNSNLVI